MEEAKEFKTIDDLQCEGKTVLVRIDINSPINAQTGKIEDNERFLAHSETLKELAKKKAKVVILAHQGRAGDEDFTTLEQHAEIMSWHIRKKIKYASHTAGQTAEGKIKRLPPGKVIMLETALSPAEETLDKNYEKTLFAKT